MTPPARHTGHTPPIGWVAPVVVLAVAAGGCAPAATAHGTSGTARRTDVTAFRLADEWAGEYRMPRYARRGPLAVTLVRCGAGMRGFATLGGLPSHARTERARARRSRRHDASAVRLALDSAQVGPGTVVLWLAPYVDPACDCTVALRLAGAIRGDTLAGRLAATSVAAAAVERRGAWRVVRRRP